MTNGTAHHVMVGEMQWTSDSKSALYTDGINCCNWVVIASTNSSFVALIHAELNQTNIEDLITSAIEAGGLKKKFRVYYGHKLESEENDFYKNAVEKAVGKDNCEEFSLGESEEAGAVLVSNDGGDLTITQVAGLFIDVEAEPYGYIDGRTILS